MKLTKTLETEILKAYHEYWNAYLKGDMRTMAYWMHENVRMIGSGRGEFFENKKDTLKYYKATAKQVAGKADMRNRKISLSAVGDNILVSEECDFFVLIKSTWTYYGEGRISTLFSKTNKGWKIIQEHGSMPDSQTSSGEQVNTDKIKAENIRLKEAVKRRTVELEDKNHELKIESALERVRAVAMGMKKPDDMLGICTAISKQLALLGVKEIRNIQTAIFYEERGTYMNYQYYAKHNKTFITDTVYTDHKIPKAFAAQMLKGKGKFNITHIKGRLKLKDWIAYQKSTNVFIDKYLYTAPSLSYYWYSLGPVALGISTYLPLTKEEENLFKRFLNVFELAYRRYLDIEKAEAQALEARIETALERVRSRSMAMHRTSELQEVIHVVHKELLQLKLSIDGGSFVVINDDIKTALRCWGSGGTANTSEEVALPPYKKPFLANLINGIKKGPEFFTEEFSQREKKDFFTFLFKHKPWSALSAKQKKETLSAPGGYTRSVAVSLYTSIVIINHQGKKFSDAENDILKRFAKVFEQTYTRFLDLQKAEAQVREAQIEAALEKVRSSSLAMHRSDEMQGVVNTVIDQLQKLHIVLDTSNILIFNDQGKFIEFWTGSNSTGAQLSTSWRVPYFNISYYKAIRMAHEKGQEIFSVSYPFKEKNKLFTHLFANSDFDKLNAERKKFILKSPRATFVAAIVKDTAIQIVSYSRDSFLVEEIGIIKRFSKVFNQAYTRFLDLQKAEAQARESQIQLALERVRARSLAMHHTSELQEVVNIVAQQLQEMSVDINGGVFITINDEVDQDIPLWSSSGVTDYTQKVIGPFLDKLIFSRMRDAIKKRNNFLTEEYSREEKLEFFHHLFKHAPWNAATKERKNEMLSREGGYTRSIAIAQHTSIAITNHNGKKFTDEDNAILKRFSNVFEQAYTRFLDLQKAEAQAREAQIEAALERVRSRSMGMQKSKEMREVIEVIFNQLVHLGFEIDTMGFLVDFTDNNEYNAWGADANEILPEKMHVTFFDHPFNQDLVNQRKSTTELFTKIYSFEEKNSFWEAIFRTITGLPKEIKEALLQTRLNSPALALSRVLLKNAGIYLFNFSGKPYSDDQNAIILRFTKAFEQSYTRFLDLEKAEAQAREAQIEAALERVRSKAMAMHKSEDIAITSAAAFEELKKLGIDSIRCGVGLFSQDSREAQVYAATQTDAGKIKTLIKNRKMDEHPALIKQFEAWEKQQDHEQVLAGEELKSYYNKSFFQTSGVKVSSNYNSQSEYGYYFAFRDGLFYSWSVQSYSNNEKDILNRFRSIIALTFRRFLDLQKAEAQAREAQIETALERVRSRTMAMHKSDELSEVIQVVFEQLQQINFNIDTASFSLNYKEYPFNIWMAAPNQPYPTKIEIPDADISIMKRIRQAIAQGLDFFAATFNYEEKNKWLNHVFEHTIIKYAAEERKKYMLNATGISISIVLLKHIALTIGNYAVIPYTDEENEILKRFANVFEQTYTRFLDLQKAEAQAREAQIEASLERVRSRTMGMQKSEELKEVIRIVYEQMVHLNIMVEHAGFIIDYKERDDLHIWLADEHLAPSEVFVPAFDCPPNNSIKEAKENGQDTFKYLLNFEEKNKFYRELFTFVPGVPEETLNYYLNCAGLAGSGVLLENIGLYIENFDGKKYSDEENAVLMRFGKVFQQTYTRFLDLQKAEAQAREAQIEAALERVRSKTMAMHSSADVSEATATMFTELEKLGIENFRGGITIIKPNQTQEVWSVNNLAEGKTISAIGSFDMKRHPWWQAIFKAKQNKEDYHYYLMTGNEKEQYREILNTTPNYLTNPIKTFPDVHAQGYFFGEGAVWSMSLQPHSEEDKQIMKRFASVFNLTFRRYQDLQKAEAQARESQIQLALERVRARTMAMQKSEELAETASVLFQQMNVLGSSPERLNIGIIKEEEGIVETWATTQDGTQINNTFNARLNEPTTIAKLFEGWKAKRPSMVVDISGEELKQWIHYLQDELKMPLKEELLRNRRVQTVAYFKQGFILMTTPEPLPLETIHLLERFAGVFDLTYTRFLDLKKAEAQAREAQIEVSLERVRSKTMAMHKSDDLLEVINLLADQFQILGFKIHSANFNTSYRDKDWNLWLYNPGVPMFPDKIHVPYFDHPYFNRTLESIAKGDDFTSLVFTKEEKDGFLDHLFTNTIGRNTPEERKQFTYNAPGFAWSTVYLKNTALTIANYDAEPYTEEQNTIIRRFGKVFEQTYTRFLDLQKAEAQAREGQIQLALERVRARTMAMQKSEELNEVAELLFKQVSDLGIKTWTTGFNVWSDDNNFYTDYITSPQGGFIEPYTIDARKSPAFKILSDAKKRGDEFLVRYEEGEALKETYRHLSKFGEKQFKAIQEIGFQFPEKQYEHFVFGSKVSLMFITYEPVLEAHDIFKRFGQVFEQTYTRFLDLQKAEAQAREAQIEAGLERVRSRTMAMRNSSELLPTADLLFDQLKHLGAELQGVAFAICDKDSSMVQKWTSIGVFSHPYNIEPGEQRMYEAWKNQSGIYEEVYEGEKQKNYYELFMKIPEFKQGIQKFIDQGFPIPTWQKNYAVPFQHGYLLFITTKPFEETQIFLRFGKVFEQTYTRFLDLQKAEAQSREAEIELGLERVRSRAMAMQSSEEVNELIGTVFTELTKLDLLLTRCIIWVFEPATNAARWWMANIEEPSNPMNFYIKYHEHPAYLTFVDEWKNQNTKFVYDLKGQDKINWDNILFNETELKNLPEVVKNGMRAPERVLLSASFNNFGGLNVASLEPLSEEHFNILLRFAKVFDLTYTRFLDLKNAEAQAREAKIEAAMEKVRARAMAMQKADELIQVAQVLRREMGLLGVEELETSSIYIHNETSGKTECWYAIRDEKKLVADHMTIDLNDTWVGREMIKFYRSDKKQVSIVMQGANRKEWINYCSEKSKALSGFYGDAIPDRTYHLYRFSNGYMGAASPGNISAESWDLLQRATNVFSLAYTRFSDLQQAEAATKEAVKQAALDRIRADIASMRTTKDLERITPLIWNELNILGLPFIRCGVFIMDNAAQLIHTFLSTPDGKAITAFHLPYTTPGNISLVLQGWRDKKQYIDHWDEQTFTDFAHSLVQQGVLPSVEAYMKTLPKGGFYLHFLPFLQGMLYVGNTNKLNDEEINLIQSLANAFSTAYARYEDFNKLEAAKKQVDSTLNELQATQKQLIQTEKMASLGELTAGIAHEIQNPLNFVNNFSEVNSELISELVDEVEKGNTEEVKALANDIKENSEKINHHGKRAGDIVKGMLQHSRKSEGKKEPTDINALCDEYLRLAYHGLRAKDKSFNAKFETSFDETLPKINVVPQDIGRVVLNLINNAFYAASLPPPGGGGFREPDGKHVPTVWVSTQKVDNKVLISVRDNGPGIPKEIMDKIFQPFFTTKPTGQGTGLGLSLSYDIVKAHGGEIKVETNEGEGTEFVIHLSNQLSI